MEKLCPAILQSRECSFGDKCKFNHDKEKFMASKPVDIGEHCYLFETYGRCPYGIACRFGKSHISTDLQNVVRSDTENSLVREHTVSNVLKKDLQVSLWKRTYDFSRSDEILAKICPLALDQKRRDQKGGKRTKNIGDAASNKGQSTSTSSEQNSVSVNTVNEKLVSNSEQSSEQVQNNASVATDTVIHSEKNIKAGQDTSGDSINSDQTVGKQGGESEEVTSSGDGEKRFSPPEVSWTDKADFSLPEKKKVFEIFFFLTNV